MNASLFWFNDEQWARIEPHLPGNQPGPERKDDRRILSGIMHVQRSGCRWKDCPSEYGPHKTIYNRFARWSERGIWQKMFAAVAGEPDVPGHVALERNFSSAMGASDDRFGHGESPGGRNQLRLAMAYLIGLERHGGQMSADPQTCRVWYTGWPCRVPIRSLTKGRNVRE